MANKVWDSDAAGTGRRREGHEGHEAGLATGDALMKLGSLGAGGVLGLWSGEART